MPIHSEEDDTRVQGDEPDTQQWEGSLAWAAEEDPSPPSPVPQRTYALPVAVIAASVAVAAGLVALAMTQHHVTTSPATLPSVSSRPAPPFMPPMPSPQPSPVEPSTEPPAPQAPQTTPSTPDTPTTDVPAPPVPPDPAVQDSEFLNDLSRDGMHFPYGTGAVVNEGHTVCKRLAVGEPRAMVVVDVIAGSVIPGYLPLTIDQARYLVDSAVTVYCSAPVGSVSIAPGHYTIA